MLEHISFDIAEIHALRGTDDPRFEKTTMVTLLTCLCSAVSTPNIVIEASSVQQVMHDYKISGELESEREGEGNGDG